MTRARTTVALWIAGVGATACYTYAPVGVDGLAPKEQVRVQVTESAAARLAPDLGSFSTLIDGQFNPEAHDSVSVGVPINRAYRGTTIGTTTQWVFLGRSEVVDVRRRQFSRPRTVLLSVGAAAGFGLLAAGIAQLVDPNGPPENGNTPPPPAPYRGLVRFRISLP